ncbi:hypothetical protein M6B38_349575 [Iris pallida]|uniref:Uncharacterized protein n=1 Tax=Iris pallida TaxID=29817 RepID=A0AAX6GRE2_IRIPA|nr:hypothetical protein M6B38_349575 [Iris pallida]
MKKEVREARGECLPVVNYSERLVVVFDNTAVARGSKERLRQWRSGSICSARAAIWRDFHCGSTQEGGAGRCSTRRWWRGDGEGAPSVADRWDPAREVDLAEHPPDRQI